MPPLFESMDTKIIDAFLQGLDAEDIARQYQDYAEHFGTVLTAESAQKTIDEYMEGRREQHPNMEEHS